MSRRKVKFGAIFVAFAIAIAGINSAIANEKRSNYPLTLVSAGFETKLEKKPTRIISLSPSATEILFAIKAGPQVLAVDDNSNYPAEIPKSELSSFTPNVEAIAAMKPDLVILQINATNARNVQGALSKLEIPVFVEPSARNLNDTYREISLLGLATDRNSAAYSLINTMKKRISKTIKSTRSKEKKTFFHELDNTLYTATSKTFIGRVYKDLGLINIADAAAIADKSGYPQLSAEYLINSNPNFIFLSNAQYGESKDTVSARPGWKTIDAVKSGRIIELPADIPSRWGPRIADFYEFVAKAIKRS